MVPLLLLFMRNFIELLINAPLIDDVANNEGSTNPYYPIGQVASLPLKNLKCTSLFNLLII